jgi:hypothetical protein
MQFSVMPLAWLSSRVATTFGTERIPEIRFAWGRAIRSRERKVVPMLGQYRAQPNRLVVEQRMSVRLY